METVEGSLVVLIFAVQWPDVGCYKVNIVLFLVRGVEVEKEEHHT